MKHPLVTALLFAALPISSAMARTECEADATMVIGKAQAHGHSIGCTAHHGNCTQAGSSTSYQMAPIGTGNPFVAVGFNTSGPRLKNGWRFSRVTTSGGNLEQIVDANHIKLDKSVRLGERGRFSLRKIYFLSPHADCGRGGMGWEEAFTGRRVPSENKTVQPTKRKPLLRKN